MTDDSVAGARTPRSKRRVALVLVGTGLAACAATAILQADPDRVSGLGLALLLAALVAGATVVPSMGRASISAGFVVITLAAALLGPASAAACALAVEIVAAWKLRTALSATLFNAFGSVASSLVGANLIRWLGVARHDEITFYLAVAGAGLVILTLNFVVVSTYFPLFRGERTLTARLFWEYTPTQALTIALAVAGASIYVKVGLPGIVFALIALFTFAYMAQLLERSRRRAEQYVSLSWGVLAGLMRALDTRDQRAARHAAAVARFARDMAREVGMGEREQELAHTAGLLHDIGHFALSDRVHERGRTLTDEDWLAIQSHPELGADMLKDLGMYGPVAEIVLCHHERVDGRGYPRFLAAEEIPEIAKIIAVAEVYDTLTARDTYRTRMSSFEALSELRRVAGSQLDARYVEVLATLLSGEGIGYRHADEADFDTELDMERRIKAARAG